MANEEHLRRLMAGVQAWNTWRAAYRPEVIDLREAVLRETDLSGADLSGADLYQADLYQAVFSEADLREAVLSDADLRKAVFSGADLSGAFLNGALLRFADLSGVDLSGAHLSFALLSEADLRGADLSGADLYHADLSEADLSGANLTNAYLTESILVRTNLKGTKLNNCRIYGISAWDLNLTGAEQAGLIITPDNEPTITVDNLKIAQFIYLLLNNAEIREAIDTITSKVVLILGRFTPERMAILKAIQEKLRERNYLPVLFDFDKPSTRDITETVSTLAHMARFVIADITDAKSIPQELMRIVPALPSVPVQPLLLASQNEYGMFEHFKHYPWVLDTFLYESLNHAIASLDERVINPVESYMTKI